MWASHAVWEMVILPNGEPPGGGSKMPLILNVMRWPSAKVTLTGEPTTRWCNFAYPLSTNAPSAPSVAIVACDPVIQSRWNIVLLGGLTAVANSFLPNAPTSPVRTFATASTIGFRAAASAAVGGIGVKLFCAVIA